MNSPLVTLDPVTNHTTAKTILSRDGYTSSLITLEPGSETIVGETDKLEEHLLFVVEGGATVRVDQVNTILNQDGALLIPRGKQHVISAPRNESAKLLRVDVPLRRLNEPEIVSFDR
jgi:mannose-6-phosphate isomerase-like protein (cupin superfamily)